MGHGQFRGGVQKAGDADAIEATITVFRDHLEAQTLAGELHTLAYATLVLETSDVPQKGTLVCRDTGQNLAVTCREPGFMRALTKLAGRSVRRSLAPNPNRAARQRVARVLLGVMAATAAVAVLWGTPRWVRYGLRSVARVTPVDVDARLGRAWLESLHLGGRVLTENPWQATLDDLVTRLAPGRNLLYDYTAIVVESPEPDALALPGGPLIFNTALLRRLTDPNALAALVAHEMAHVSQRHLMQRLSQTLGVTTSVQFFFGDVDAVMRTPPGQLQLDVLLRPEDETEADHVALTLLTLAQLDPGGLATLIAALTADVHAGMSVPWLQRGPPPAKRLADLRARLRQRPKGRTPPPPR